MSWQSTPLLALRISRKPRRQIAERHCRREQRVQPRIGAAAPRASVRRRRWVQRARCEGATWPTWLETSRKRRLWKAPPSGTGTWRVAIPAQLEHGRLEAGKRQRGGKPGRGAAGVDHQIAVGRRRLGRRKTDAELARQFGARRVDIDQRHLRAGKLGRRDSATSAPTTPAPTTAMRLAGLRLGIPHGVERGLHIGGQHGACRRHVVGQRHDSVCGHIEQALMRMQREHASGRSAPPVRPRPGRRSSNRISPETGSCRP